VQNNTVWSPHTYKSPIKNTQPVMVMLWHNVSLKVSLPFQKAHLTWADCHMCPHDSQCWHGAAADVADHMPYVDAVIKETIRLYDPATVLFRRALEDILVDGNLVIPKVCGSSHCAMQLFTHRARGMGGLGQRVYCPSVISLYA